MTRFKENIGLWIALLINKVRAVFALNMHKASIINTTSLRFVLAALTERFYAELLRVLLSNMKTPAYYCSKLLWIEWRLAPFERPPDGHRK
ncbi:MAG: hypothetical protein FWF09_02190 [Bacteroidales bacterium]|nr:hypothetical protein [Bacteroidales bacterium]